MATVKEITDPLLSVFTPVPQAGPGICDVCHGAPSSGYSRCYSCSQATSQVTWKIDNVVPVSLYVVSSQLHKYLRWYKDGDQRERDRFTPIVGAIAGRFLAEHGACIRAAFGDWDAVTSLPSTHRAPPHPLERALRMVSTIDPVYEQLLTPGPVQRVGRNADDGLYTSSPKAQGRTVLLIDDTFTTGASLESAASALTASGATVVAAVVIGRVINPGFSSETAALWEQQRSVPYSFETCCLE